MDMQFREFFLRMTKKQRESFAERVGISYEVLRQISKHNRSAGALLAKKIEEESYGLVKRGSLRPDIFGE